MKEPMDFSTIRQAVQAIGDAIQTRLAQREALAQERDRVASLAMHRDDLIQAVDAWIDGVRPLYAKHLKNVLEPLSRKPDRPVPEARHGDFGLIAADGKVMPFPLLALLGPHLKTALHDLIRELPLADAEALPAPERRAKLAELDERIEEVDSELATLREQAALAGLAKIRRQPTREEIAAHFAHGRPLDPAAEAEAVERLTRRINNEPDIKPPPLPAAPVTAFEPGDLPDDF